MGLCASGLTDDQRAAIAESNKLDRVLNSQSEQDARIIKLLLLGTGESGKSTIFKQMQILYQKEKFSAHERQTFTSVIRRNIVEAMQTLIMGSQRFGFAMSSQYSRECSQFISQLDPLGSDFWAPQIVPNVTHLWHNEPAIQRTYDNRSKLQLLDSTEYLIQNIERIGAPGYSPSEDDILRARLRTSGIVERSFSINGVDFTFLDVGGQRNERRKWIHCFDNVTAIIFVAAISEYDQTLYEDEKENRLKESIRVFESICNNKAFINTAMILFLNKNDLFADKIQKHSLRLCFPDYDGRDGHYEDATKYIQERFLEVNEMPGRLIFPHFTNATDTDNVKRVFENCKAVILDNNLKKLGLM